jgi:hypothetical protein
MQQLRDTIAYSELILFSPFFARVLQRQTESYGTTD